MKERGANDGGGFLHELGRLGNLAGPLWLQNSAQMALGLIAVAFVGHLGDPLALSQVVLANSVFNISGSVFIMGLSAGMETFCGQAIGAGNHAFLGVVLQRAGLITLLACLPITLLWAHTGPILTALGQPSAIVAGAARYLWQVAPAIWLMAPQECLKRYLLAQRVVLPGTLIAGATTLAAPLFYSLIMNRLRPGLDGAAAAFVLCSATSTVLLAAYTAHRDWRRRGRPDATWAGLSRGALEGWGEYLALAVPALGAIAAEWLAFECMIVSSGLLPNAEVAMGVMGLAFQCSAAAYMSSMALSAAANTRVANELGAGHGAAAARSCWVALAAVAATQAALSVGVMAGGRRLAGLLSNNEEVLALTMQLLPFLAASFVGDGINAVLQGVLRGAGRQLLGAGLNALGYWVLGVPFALLLGFKAGLGVVGFWAGLCATTSSQALLQAAVVARLDWRREAARARELVGGMEGGGGGGGGAAGGGGCFAVASDGAAPAGAAAEERPRPDEERRPLLLDASRSFSDRGSFAERGGLAEGIAGSSGGAGGAGGGGAWLGARLSSAEGGEAGGRLPARLGSAGLRAGSSLELPRLPSAAAAPPATAAGGAAAAARQDKAAAQARGGAAADLAGRDQGGSSAGAGAGAGPRLFTLGGEGESEGEGDEETGDGARVAERNGPGPRGH
ncbi:MATE efflux family protein [Raphidocelis subcapitata]|uniref:Protein DETOXIFICATION n=1 Tax=Raphidocelis subcapitata TaxID=307507 RepID=A0A2V0NQ35_9CHLO|nr:MATE efflux family protein [Raphidocelis subcapitata]|eukprot:GBF89389.1 MATE efflux family protein [Raphidocelis subcapitata]